MNENIVYVLAVIAVTLVSIIAVTLIVILRPGQDNSAIIGSIFASVAPATLALLSLLKSQQSLTKSEETHDLVNSRIDEFKSVLEASALDQSTIARAEGVAQGTKQERNK